MATDYIYQRYPDKTQAEFSRSVRVLGALAIALLIIFLVEDFLQTPEHFARLAMVKGGAALVILTALGLQSTRWVGDNLPQAVLLIISVLYVTVIYQTAIIQVGFLPPVLAIVCCMASAIMFPWGLSYQSLLIAISLVAISAGIAVLDSAGYWLPPRESLAGAVFSVVSWFIAYYQREVRQSLWEAESKLEGSEERFRQVAENSKDIIYIWGADRNIHYINPAFRRYTGIDPQALYENPYEVLSTVHPEDRDKYGFALEEIMLGKSRQLDLRIIDPDGKTHFFEAWGSPVLDERGEVSRCIGIWRDITERAQLVRKLKRYATTDPLTGCFNRRHFYELAEDRVRQLRRSRGRMALIYFDIDHFKRINDEQGHNAGDLALQQISALCRKALREVDILARFGGEEFIVLMSDADQALAIKVAERLRSQVEQLSLSGSKSDFQASISLGISCQAIDDDFKIEHLILAADQALLEAKKAGRNRAVFKPAG